MLLDVGGVLLGVGLAVVGFAVVVIVSALVLRLLGVVLGDGARPPSGVGTGEDGTADAGEPSGGGPPTDDSAAP